MNTLTIISASGDKKSQHTAYELIDDNRVGLKENDFIVPPQKSNEVTLAQFASIAKESGVRAVQVSGDDATKSSAWETLTSVGIEVKGFEGRDDYERHFVQGATRQNGFSIANPDSLVSAEDTFKATPTNELYKFARELQPPNGSNIADNKFGISVANRQQNDAQLEEQAKQLVQLAAGKGWKSIVITDNRTSTANTVFNKTAMSEASKLGIEAKPLSLHQAEKRTQADELLRKKLQAEQILAVQADTNSLAAKSKPVNDLFITPRQITNNYNETNGKFFAKDSERLVFQDKGDSLVSSSDNKAAVSDMVAYAKAKQWGDLSLKGSVEFRREAWLQAESQGIKTTGYTPKEVDVAALQSLTAERSKNTITPLADKTTVIAPRNTAINTPAQKVTEASKNEQSHLATLQANPAFKNRSFEDLQAVAKLRSLLAEDAKSEPPAIAKDTLSRFDVEAAKPDFLERVKSETPATIEDKTIERTAHKVSEHDTHSL